MNPNTVMFLIGAAFFSMWYFLFLVPAIRSGHADGL
jgi:hypothetical protein